MERAGISLKRMSELTGYNKSTLWHAANDGKYRRRLSRRFWGKVGATIRWKIKPLVLRLSDEGIVAIRCPHCKTILRVKVGDKTKIEIEPIVPEATKGSKTMSK
jgi:phage FluMu protein Com